MPSSPLFPVKNYPSPPPFQLNVAMFGSSNNSCLTKYYIEYREEGYKIKYYEKSIFSKINVEDGTCI